MVKLLMHNHNNYQMVAIYLLVQNDLSHTHHMEIVVTYIDIHFYSTCSSCHRAYTPWTCTCLSRQTSLFLMNVYTGCTKSLL